MRFLFYTSLSDAARQAFDKGNGKHGPFTVKGNYLTYDGKTYTITKGTIGPAITEKTA